MFYVRAYYGLDTITVAKGRTRAGAQRALEKYKRERNKQEMFCLNDWIFWIEEQAS